MKAREVIDKLFNISPKYDFTGTCDTCKVGDPEKEVGKIAFSMFATPDTVNAAKAWGADMLIVHEPTYYNHMDVHSDEKIENMKRRFLEDSGLVIYRYHDHVHATLPDTISEGEFNSFGLDGEYVNCEQFGLSRYKLHEGMTPRELARRIEERCGIAHIRICGAADVKCNVISGMFGTPGNIFDELKDEASEIVITGEACEWMLGEYARDAAQLGVKKALLILGHIGSERDGMKLAAERMNKFFPDIESKYFECGEVYTYTDR